MVPDFLYNRKEGTWACLPCDNGEQPKSLHHARIHANVTEYAGRCVEALLGDEGMLAPNALERMWISSFDDGMTLDGMGDGGEEDVGFGDHLPEGVENWHARQWELGEQMSASERQAAAIGDQNRKWAEELAAEAHETDEDREGLSDTDPTSGSCTLDVVTHLQRTTFSEIEQDLILWLLKINGAAQVPSVNQVKAVRDSVQRMGGVNSIHNIGTLGHTYYILDIGHIIADEFANPKVRKFLEFYPRDSGQGVTQTWEFARWLTEADPTYLTPMVRVGIQDYFTSEPCLLKDGSVCMPHRWFRKGAAPGRRLCGRAWRMTPMHLNNQWGWVIEKNHDILFDTEELLLNFPEFDGAYPIWGMLHVRSVMFGSQLSDEELVCKVFACPIWLYCDDTSGNRSKKWNEHYSYLFALAGLPRDQWQRDFNVHFACTSNVAAPLEMLEGVVEQLDLHGVWAYDCVLQEMVLFFVPVHGMLGDNPMQSEFASHIGLRGNFFCCCCWAKGHDVEDERPTDRDSGDEDGPRNEPLEVMTEHVKRFTQIGRQRERHETMATTGQIFQKIQDMAPQKDIRMLTTNTGMKDNFFEHFRKRLENARKGRTGAHAEHAMLRELEAVPHRPWNPVWRLRELDPHRDTPVEILHVILLGVVKYFWHDAIARTNDEQKTILKARLTCLDVCRLDPELTRVPGHTYVQYAGSLVGRDFRAIAQVAIFALYDMLPPEILEAWAALGTLVPMVWSPCIADLDMYLHMLSDAIKHFLACTASWTPRWFNKPKFHLLLHLPEHIRRLGPAILFATETFESYNAIIRAWSIHSNRKAPSRDIAQRAAHCHRIRHLMSGGFYKVDTDLDVNPDTPPEWRTIGPGPASLVCQPNVLCRYLGLREESSPAPGTMSREGQGAPIPWVRLGSAVESISGARILIGGYAIRQPQPPHALTISHVIEAFSILGSDRDGLGLADWVLVRDHILGPLVRPYQMPQLVPTSQYALICPTEMLCALNVQHNCAAHACSLDLNRVVYQEREASRMHTKAVRHLAPEDILLNTAKMRDQQWINTFSSSLTHVDMDILLAQACRDELERTRTNPP
ncbi:hypothetical protein JB92DRAFT_3082782 [Gautieria morchelliformis]|nr:hypothetical protein JB92DRAFT_3082782 [Gautieria morchelliformis]